MIYVLCVERWGGNSYYSEIINAYADEELANNHALQHQGEQRKCDVRFYVEEVRLIGRP